MFESGSLQWAVVGTPCETTLTALNVTRRERGCRCFSRERNTAKSNEMKTRWRPTLEATHVTRRLPPTISNVGHVTARQLLGSKVEGWAVDDVRAQVRQPHRTISKHDNIFSSSLI